MPENIKKGTLLNFIAYGLSGLFLFLFNIVAARSLGPKNFGIISVLWSAVIVVSRFFTTGIKDGATRFISIYEATNNTKSITRVFRQNTKFTVIVTILFFFISLIFFKFLTANLYSNYSSLYIIFLVASALYFFLFFLRGTLQGLRELKHSAISIIIEYSVMLLSILLLFTFLSKDVRLAGLSILLAPLASLIFITVIMQKHRRRFSQESSLLPSTKTLLLFIIPTSFINFSSGFITALGPLFIKLLGDFRLAGVFAASLVIFKGARTILTSLFISIFPHLARQEALKNYDMFNRIIKNGLIFVVLVFMALIVISLTIGQSIIEIIYGTEFAIERIHLLLMSLFTGFFLLSELFNRVLLAKSMIKELTIAWLIALAVLIVLLLLPLSALFRVEFALLGTGITAFTGMILFLIFKKPQDERQT